MNDEQEDMMMDVDSPIRSQQHLPTQFYSITNNTSGDYQTAREGVDSDVEQSEDLTHTNTNTNTNTDTTIRPIRQRRPGKKRDKRVRKRIGSNESSSGGEDQERFDHSPHSAESIKSNQSSRTEAAKIILSLNRPVGVGEKEEGFISSSSFNRRGIHKIERLKEQQLTPNHILSSSIIIPHHPPPPIPTPRLEALTPEANHPNNRQDWILSFPSSFPQDHLHNTITSPAHLSIPTQVNPGLPHRGILHLDLNHSDLFPIVQQSSTSSRSHTRTRPKPIVLPIPISSHRHSPYPRSASLSSSTTLRPISSSLTQTNSSSWSSTGFATATIIEGYSNQSPLTSLINSNMIPNRTPPRGLSSARRRAHPDWPSPKPSTPIQQVELNINTPTPLRVPQTAGPSSYSYPPPNSATLNTSTSISQSAQLQGVDKDEGNSLPGIKRSEGISREIGIGKDVTRRYLPYTNAPRSAPLRNPQQYTSSAPIPSARRLGDPLPIPGSAGERIPIPIPGSAGGRLPIPIPNSASSARFRNGFGRDEREELKNYVKELNSRAEEFWTSHETTDCRIIIPLDKRSITPRTGIPPTPSGNNPPLTPSAPIPSSAVQPSTPSSARSLQPPPSLGSGRRMSGYTDIPVTVFNVHSGYLTTQSGLFHALFAHKTSFQMNQLPPLRSAGLGPGSGSGHSPQNKGYKGSRWMPPRVGEKPTLWVPLPDPGSFSVLLHWMYWGDNLALESAIHNGLVSWQGIVRNIEYLEASDSLKRVLGQWWKTWIEPSGGRQAKSKSKSKPIDNRRISDPSPSNLVSEPMRRSFSSQSSEGGGGAGKRKGKMIVPPGLEEGESGEEADEEEEEDGGEGEGEGDDTGVVEEMEKL
ncbi:hypothetical protein M231_06582 [Tremella mesenterica]|uniref:BTB domain-containing protein n=1 Tax=Tremella mesenterica TaxID=5217 RepID=A0A4V1M3A0_TREME|nr:hypothetical protein M231_06582 [Tremella mesenterica]